LTSSHAAFLLLLRYDLHMVVTLKKSGDTFTFQLSPQAVEELALKDGSSVTIEPTQEAKTPSIRYATVEEALAAFDETLPRHEAAYRELAK
jgi:antitoxin component of MazEF toxin-antitoxin module